MLLQQIANGIMLGSTYALVAIGYTLVFGVLRLLHLAHGEVYMVGAFIGLQLMLWLPVGPLTAILGALVGCALLGVVLEFIAFLPIASILGIDVDKVIVLTFAVASALGGVAGVLVGLAFNAISPFMGTQMVVKGMAVMLIGGLGNVYGAMVGGLVLGLVEVLSVA